MPQIRPVSDLRNHFADISRIIHESEEPIFLTKNGYGDMVVMSIESYEKFQLEHELYFKLREAAIEAKETDIRYSHEDVFSNLKDKLQETLDAETV